MPASKTHSLEAILCVQRNTGSSLTLDLVSKYCMKFQHYLSKFADSSHRDICDGEQLPHVTHVMDIFEQDR